MLNVTGPPWAVSVNVPVHGPPVAGCVSRTMAGDAVRVPGDGGGEDGGGGDECACDADGLGDGWGDGLCGVRAGWVLASGAGVVVTVDGDADGVLGTGPGEDAKGVVPVPAGGVLAADGRG